MAGSADRGVADECNSIAKPRSIERFISPVHEMKISLRDIGILPLLLSCPFMYYPKVVDGDTQPWVLIAALIAVFTFRTNSFVNRRDRALIILSFLCILIYAFRSAFGFELLRNTYTYLMFLMLWMVCEREKGEYFPIAVRSTVVIWFVVGLYQYISSKMGYQIEFSGRFVEGRSGVPSLTSEASYYGSLSMLHLMYLLTNKTGRNGIFIAFAAASVVLSGSLLAVILLAFPLWKLPVKLRISTVVILPLLVVGDYYLTSAGVTARLKDITSEGVNLSSFLLDPSLNLRAGMLYFTMFENLIPSLLLVGPIDFMHQYNSFALNSGLLIETGSNYIVTAIGDMIYGGGVVAVLLLLIFLKRAQENCSIDDSKIMRVAFIIACMLNPISLSNIFLIMYAQSKD